MAWVNAPPRLAIQSPRPRSTSSTSSEASSRGSSPVLTGLDSSSALILVHDSEDSNIPFDFSSDDEDDDHSPQFEVRRASVTPLGPPVVFLYLLSPYLKLGALFLPHTSLPLKYGLPSLFAFAGLSAFARQIWYMLAQYMRAADLEDVILDAFARGRGKERHRSILRSTVRVGTGALRVLLATTYLRRAAHVLLPLLPNWVPMPVRIVSTIALSVVIFPLFLAQSLASKRVVYATWLSLVTYVAWLGLVTHAHAQGALRSSAGWLRMGIFWEGITIIAFAFTSSSTLPLYASLKGTTQPITTAKTSRTRSFNILSALSVSIAILLTFPLILFSANPNDPETLSSLSPFSFITLPVLNAATLLLGIPSIIITTPSLPIPERIRRASTIPISKLLLYTLVVALALVPKWIASVLNDFLVISAISSTFFLPAVVHVTAHFFKRPLAIVMPQSTPPESAPRDGSWSGSRSPHSGRPDELLLRKERALQRRQFKKRIVWDVGVCGMCVGGAAGLVWAVGRVARRW